MSGYSSAIGSFVIGYSPIGGYVDLENTSILGQTIPSYLYQEYQDDDNIASLVMSYNDIAQNFATFFNQIGLPVYTGGQISGSLLDWVGQGIYGIARPVFTTTATLRAGPIATFAIASGVTIGGYLYEESGTATVATDDIYKRVMTWNLYKGDGFQFSTPWLKRRIYRFLNGINGTDPGVSQTYTISVDETPGEFAITVPNTTAAQFLSQAFANGVLNVPFQYSFEVTY